MLKLLESDDTIPVLIHRKHRQPQLGIPQCAAAQVLDHLPQQACSCRHGQNFCCTALRRFLTPILGEGQSLYLYHFEFAVVEFATPIGIPLIEDLWARPYCHQLCQPLWSRAGHTVSAGEKYDEMSRLSVANDTALIVAVSSLKIFSTSDFSVCTDST